MKTNNDARIALIALLEELNNIEDVDAGNEEGLQVAGNILEEVIRAARAACMGIGTGLVLRREYIRPDDGERIPAGSHATITAQNPGGGFYIDFDADYLPAGVAPYGWNDFSPAEVLNYFSIQREA